MLSPMSALLRKYRYSGAIHPDDVLHVPVDDPAKTIAPSTVAIPGGLHVPQYAPTVKGGPVRYDPERDCQGYFMPYQFKVNNNCYAYACDIASNSFAQPGRKHGYHMMKPYVPADVQRAAEQDGLIRVNTSSRDMGDLRRARPGTDGHFVALLVSEAAPDLQWLGDYHWVRCDDSTTCVSWSQKDGEDAVTDFDFAVKRIANPSEANWSVNYGRIMKNDRRDVVVNYGFVGFFYVPANGVDII